MTMREYYLRLEAYQLHEVGVREHLADDTMGLSEKAKHHTQTEIFMRRIEQFKKLKAEGRIDMNAWKHEGGR